jgi:hypothetical protein
LHSWGLNLGLYTGKAGALLLGLILTWGATGPGWGHLGDLGWSFIKNWGVLEFELRALCFLARQEL